jgi:L-lactate utilization protein LutC
MSRDEFLAQVKQAAEAGRAWRVHTSAMPEGTGYVGAAGDLCDAMAAEVEAVGGHAHLVDDDEAACRALVALLEQYAPKSALCWQHPLLERLGIDRILAERNIARHDHTSLAPQSHEQQRATMLAADIGITSADFAIAETGTLVVCSKPGRERAASLLPPVHVAVIERTQIVPDLFDVPQVASRSARGRDEPLPTAQSVATPTAKERTESLSRSAPDSTHDLPSSLVLITGPSKTGDIELKLTTGVHGPGHWHVVIIRRREFASD